MSRPPRLDEADIARRAADVDLSIAAASRAAVAQHLAALLAAVRLLEEFPLPEPTEPAPSFQP